MTLISLIQNKLNNFFLQVQRKTVANMNMEVFQLFVNVNYCFMTGISSGTGSVLASIAIIMFQSVIKSENDFTRRVASSKCRNNNERFCTSLDKSILYKKIVERVLDIQTLPNIDIFCRLSIISKYLVYKMTKKIVHSFNFFLFLDV